MLSPTAKQMPSGAIIDLETLSFEQVNFRDIASSLAKICRFTGATFSHYSVAQHSILVAGILPPQLQVYGLLHDAHEAYLGDIATPVKNLLRRTNSPVNLGPHPLDYAENLIDAAIFKAARLPWPLGTDDLKQLKLCDFMAFNTERLDLMLGGDSAVPQAHRVPRLPVPKIKAWPWPEAEDRFIEALRTYLPQLDLDRRYH
jgi:hypothetical protein